MNSSKRFPFLATLLLLALPASGAVRYRFTTEGRGGLAPFDRSGSVFVDGTRARIETKSVDLDSVRLWSAEGQACSHLNSSRKTYYQSGCGLDQMLSFATKTERVAKTTKMNVKLLDEGDAVLLRG